MTDLAVVDQDYAAALGRNLTQYADRDLDRLWHKVRHHAGHDEAWVIKTLNILNEDAWSVLKDRTIARLERSRDKELGFDSDSNMACNNLLAMLQLMRYEGINDQDLFDTITLIIKIRHPHFYPIVLQRIRDILLRFQTDDVDPLKLYGEIGNRRQKLGDIPGKIDTDWRLASRDIDRMDLPRAEQRLKIGILRAESEEYVEDPRIIRMPTEGKSDKIANMNRSLAKVHRLYGMESRGTNVIPITARKNFEEAKRRLEAAYWTYRNIKQWHGVAHCYYEAGLLEIAKGAYNPDRPRLFEQARKHYVQTGDLYKIKLCDARIKNPSELSLYEAD